MSLLKGGYGYIQPMGGRMINGRYTNSPFISTGYERANNRKFYEMISPYSRTKHKEGFLNALNKLITRNVSTAYHMLHSIHGFTQSLSHSGVINAIVHENIHPGNVPFTLRQIKIFDDILSTLYWQTFRKEPNVSNTTSGATVRFTQLVMMTLTSALPNYIYDQSKDIDNYTINYKKMQDQLKHENPSFDTDTKPEYFINEDRLSQITMQIICKYTKAKYYNNINLFTFALNSSINQLIRCNLYVTCNANKPTDNSFK